ncbi:MAG: hypothetical protein C7B47_04325 [Sulfobacillus thermosulfidooxidans]|uniref:Spo0E like sporulation regulatory protein n=1 Tax=Sulfobacillus thermosulfidooxidans TaxID=28034 RepID=A0A2T2X1Q3_SULTH|nr:MAG: hypothetical protein C7B47_04325 [Sulfobacillus thermosulfidooxidans]
MREEAEQIILDRISKLKRELDRIYASTLDIYNRDLMAVSHEVDQLLVRYLRRQPLVAEQAERMAGD